MAGQKPKSARTIAIEVLNHFNPKRNYAGPILNKLLGETDQKQRATDLVLGTIRNSRAIDTVIATFSGRPIERIPGKLLNIIRIGTYELIYSPATGQHSIVNEAVENAKALVGKKQVGFVNAVLRQITRHITNRQIQLLPQADSRCTLAQTPAIGCEFDKDFLPDPEALPVDYLSTVFSLPRWLVSDWLGEFGEELTRQICFASNRRPSIYIRPNSLKTTTQDLAQKLKKDGVEANITPDESMIKLKSPQAVTQLPGFAEGLFTIQDITASQAVRILKPQPDWTILDLCAAPGVKTTQLAEATGDSATIIATDIDAERLKKVKENTTRLGINSANIVSYEEIRNSKFDCVLLDVPCSNTGVLARRIEVRYRIKPKAIKELTKTQSKLLATAAPMVKPHGKICYSTCSIQKDENNDLVRDFLQKNRNFELKSEMLTLPSATIFDHDGGYTAILTATK
ncbi:MAG: methyltransferase domain-containing protein [Planctomycetes bacterium]|nr:methyltransferase domain-containing protein [Planctomycetota bacterium]